MGPDGSAELRKTILWRFGGTEGSKKWGLLVQQSFLEKVRGMRWKSKVFSPGPSSLLVSAGLLVLRVASGAMIAVGHGLPKLKNFGQLADGFPDPLGMGSRLSLLSTVGAEFFCGLALVLGLATRLVSLPLAFAMGVAAFVVHGSDPWFFGEGVGAAKELALLFLVPFLTLLITGPGRYSLDALIAGKGT